MESYELNLTSKADKVQKIISDFKKIIFKNLKNNKKTLRNMKTLRNTALVE